MWSVSQSSIRLALPKGRILPEALQLLKHAGLGPEAPLEQSRALFTPSVHPNLVLVVLRASDVPGFVEYGAVEMGIVGKDTLLEHSNAGYYEPLDMVLGLCRLMVAGLEGTDHLLHDQGSPSSRLKVATKYPCATRNHFARRNRQVEIVPLSGSIELAPLLGLSDLIVDLVATGRTLADNGLAALEHVADISARLIVNRAALKTRSGAISTILQRCETALQAYQPS
jgi:ATP phosphoribosyltransferase